MKCLVLKQLGTFCCDVSFKEIILFSGPDVEVIWKTQFREQIISQSINKHLC